MFIFTTPYKAKIIAAAPARPIAPAANVLSAAAAFLVEVGAAAGFAPPAVFEALALGLLALALVELESSFLTLEQRLAPAVPISIQRSLASEENATRWIKVFRE